MPLKPPTKSRQDTPRRWRIRITTQSAKLPTTRSALLRTIAKILDDAAFQDLPPEFSEVSVLFTNDRMIHQLNRSYREKDKPTDVLSFPQEEDWQTALHSPSLGDIVISVETALRQSKKFGVTYRNEILRLLTHGLLHLAGYDHERVSAKKAQQMRRTERRILKSL